MARKRDPRRDEAFEIWKATKGEKPLKDIASDLGCSPSQIRKWKSQDKWEDNSNVTNSKGSVTKSTGKPKKQKKRSGNPNPRNQFTKRNNAAMKHGLFSRYMTQETLEIMNFVEDSRPADLLWHQIQIQYAAIIRSQKIMWVEDKDEMIKELKKVKEGHSDTGSSSEEEWEFQFAWDRQATFLTAQSRAIGELRSSIKQFNVMADEDDERRLKLEQMQLGIDKTKLEIDKISGDGKSDTVDDWVAAMGEVDE